MRAMDDNLFQTEACDIEAYEISMRPVRIRHSSHHFATQSSHFVDRAGWQAKMASIAFWIPWCNAHGPHSLHMSVSYARHASCTGHYSILMKRLHENPRMDSLHVYPQSLFSSPPEQYSWMFALSWIKEWLGGVFWDATWCHYANGLLPIARTFHLGMRAVTSSAWWGTLVMLGPRWAAPMLGQPSHGCATHMSLNSCQKKRKKIHQDQKITTLLQSKEKEYIYVLIPALL